MAKLLNDDQIIVELNRRKSSGELRADDSQAGGPFPPLSTKALQKAEEQLGFTLPPLLRRIYTEIANGGFGYSYGFLGLFRKLFGGGGGIGAQGMRDFGEWARLRGVAL
jgi:hypothetical protein